MVWSRHPMSGNVVFWEARVRFVRMRMAARSTVVVLGTGVLAVATLAGSAVTAHAATPVEINSQNPVTAEPPVSRPDTKACTVSLATDFPSNTASGAPQDFTGTLTPPPACPGPWSKVVLDWTTQVQGRQFDRSGDLTIGGVTVYFGTTYEPDPAGITYRFAKDLTEYSAIFSRPQPYDGGIGNYVNSTDTGVYDQTVTLTFYAADHGNPAPAEPNDVVGLGAKDADAATPTVDWTIAGYVDTSRGRIPVSVTQQADFRNVDTVSGGGSTQVVRESDAGWTRSDSGGQVAVHTWSYPVDVTETFHGTDDNNFDVTGTVWLQRQLSDRAGGRTLATSTDTMRSTAVDERSNGVTVAAGGTEWQHYAGTDDTGGWYDHYIAAKDGYVTADRLRTG